MSTPMKKKIPTRAPKLSPVEMLRKLDGYFAAAGYDCDHPWRYELAGTMAAVEDADDGGLLLEEVKDASLKINALSNANELLGLNLEVMLDSIVDRLDELSDKVHELGVPLEHTHGNFNAMHCYIGCAQKMVAEFVSNSLSMARQAREVAK